MTRRQERRARLLRWAGCVAAGGAAGVVTGGWWGLVPAVLGLAIGHRAMIAAPGVAVLTYHSVSPDARWLPWSREITVHPDTLATHLAVLARIGATVIGTREWVRRRAGGEAMPERAVVLHFDDGYRDNHVHAAPLLRAAGMTATVFASLDFVDPAGGVRSDGVDHGYMTWDELADLEAQGIEVEPHGVAHARVPVSDAAEDVLTATNWRRHAWLQWDATPGPKHDWYARDVPVAVPLGAPVPRSGLALAARAWRDGAHETAEVLSRRIEEDLAACQMAFAARLRRMPQIFCWPENVVGVEGRAIARRLGYRGTTAGRGRNTADEPADVISRVHVGDRAIGVRWQAAEALAFRAQVRLMQGNHYWYLVLAPMNALRRVVFALRRDPFA
ncbi:polysaccharide deacetylase family protein [Sphingomonas adhaesiva]|uniref:polysaccharide deacetylase family protein n=1 Tax=Sphingomonas adhaesiva TaxID=28212 RepID=UPI002FFCF30E